MTDLKSYSNIQLDFGMTRHRVTIEARQGDKHTRYVRACAICHGAQLTLEGITARAEYKQANGKGSVVDCEVEPEGYVVLELTDLMLSVPGVMSVTMVLYKDGAFLTSQDFDVRVRPRLVDDETPLPDVPEMSVNQALAAMDVARAATEEATAAATTATTKAEEALTEAEEATTKAEEAIASLNSGGIPDYWQTALETGVQAINEKLCVAGKNKSAFLFYSDAHWNYGSQMSPTLLKYLYKHTGLTKTIFGGDIVNDEATDYDTMAYLWEWRDMLKDLPNHHSVVGNHDDGNSTNNLFSEQYVYGYLLAAEETPDIVRGEGMYYYIDHSPEKTRYLYLDTAYKGLDDTQKEFIKQALISTPSGWHIVVISHIWYMPDYDQYDLRPVPVTGLSTDATTLTAILDAYNSRTGDYADCGGWVEFCVGGHIHYDYDGTTETGIPIVLVETDSKHIRGTYTYTAGTTTEASVNGIIADYDNHKIYIVRIGRGESREVEITNYIVSYTNVLPLALAADGTSIYNDIGYKADTRWSTSGNAEGTVSGVYLTGWIPISPGDIVYLKNIVMPTGTGNTSCVHFFTNSFTEEASTQNGTGLDTYNSAVRDDDGNLIQFTVASSSDYTHMRIQCGGITEASIITINEPIE